MDFIQLLEDYNVPYITEGVNVGNGWIGVKCPFCGDDPSEHLGFHLESGATKCWRCGKHSTTLAIALLLNITAKQAVDIIKRYGGTGVVPTPTTEVTTGTRPHQLPFGTGPLMANHERYLTDRLFDPDKLVHDWGLLGTGPLAPLTTGPVDDEKTIDFKHRIIIPITWDGKQVSFQGRDITGKSDLRYITCPEDREIIHHKCILGGRQEHWTSTGIIVEGWFDVFRFGLQACCTFGIQYTREQVRLIAKIFNRVAVCYDDEPQAVAQARLLISQLKLHNRNIDAWWVPIKGDPGAMDQTEANQLVKQILK
jgi:hypothetical protein